MSPVDQYITQRFLNLYGAPDVVSPEAFIAEYDLALGKTDPMILKDASDLLVRQHTYRNWPTVGECVQAVEIIATRHAVAKKVRELNKPPGKEYHERPTEESKTRVDDLIREAAAARTVTVKKLSEKHKGESLPPVDWARGQKPAWEADHGVEAPGTER